MPVLMTADNEARAFAIVEEMNRLECRGEVVETHVGRPSAEREEHKQRVQATLGRPRAQRLLAQADELYDAYAELAPTSPRG